ncbi:MAG: NUDIX domain-containing protein [Candidatus Saccharimonadales bacterium]|nr:NUDIX domain-containing protein [Candidatus Saccharimonadales bacterium]
MARPEPIKQFRKYFKRRQPAIQEVVREPTAGGIVYRLDKKGRVEILLIQDAKDRWTIPKGHIEEGESAKQTAVREITEETGLKDMRVIGWLGKINFRYRRQHSLVLMTTQIFLILAEGNTDKLKKEEWMNGIGWFKAPDALDKIEYEDIGKLMLLGLKKIRESNN